MKVGIHHWERRKPVVHDWSHQCFKHKNTHYPCHFQNCRNVNIYSNVGVDAKDYENRLAHGDVVIINKHFTQQNLYYLVEELDFYGENITFICFASPGFNEILKKHYLYIPEHMIGLIDQDMLYGMFPDLDLSIVPLLSTLDQMSRSNKKLGWKDRTIETIINPLFDKLQPKLCKNLRNIIIGFIFK